jgi:uncharacterized protein
MPINATHEFYSAEKKYLAAQNMEQKIMYLEEMIREAPGHKGSENLLKELRTRLKKFKASLEKSKKSGKGKKGIRKEGFQVGLVGLTNSGKSCLLKKLTNASPKVSSNLYTTKDPEIGTMFYDGVKAQVVDFPAVEGKDAEYGTLNTSDLLIIVVEKLEDIKEVESYLGKAVGKRIVVRNKIDSLNDNERRKLKERMKSKRIKGLMVSCITGEGVDELKGRIFEGMDVIRVYTKEPGKKASKDPIVLSAGSRVRDVAEKILKGFSKRIKETRLTGPSGKFSNQRVGLKHVCKDKDVVEFRD